MQQKLQWIHIPKMHGADKAVNQKLKPNIQVKREGMPEVVPEPPAQTQTISPVQPIGLQKVGQKRATQVTCSFVS